MARIGLIGYGYLGSYVYEQIQTWPELGLDIAFVYNRSPQKLAHPDITRRHGAAFLAHTDYMPLSLTCLAETALERTLLAAAVQNDSRLYVLDRLLATEPYEYLVKPIRDRALRNALTAALAQR